MSEIEEFEGISDLVELYSEIDEMIDAFISQTGITCPRSCGTCCATPTENVEASVFEVMPLALDLWERGQAEHVLEKLREAAGAGSCIFYMPEIPDGAAGHCPVHPLRPLICRLFGYSARYDKYGVLENCLCPKMTSPLTECPADNRAPLPVMTEYASRAASLNPNLGTRRQPLNDALAAAISIVGMKRSYLGFPAGHSRESGNPS
jgi:uncharacterized protein